MYRCDKLLADHTKCGRKAYKDQKCFPHWNRTVPKWYLRNLDREMAQKMHFSYQHKCPLVGVCYLHPNFQANGREKYVN